MFDIITLGSATVDLFVETHPEIIVRRKERKHIEELLAYPLGSKIIVKNIYVKTGGGGTNSAVSFSRLGFNTAFFGVLGRDKEAAIIYEDLKKEGVRFIGQLKEKSGISIILDAVGEDRTILVYRGDNDKLEWSDSYKKFFTKTKAIYVAPLHGKAVDTGLKAISFAKKQGKFVALNLSSYMIEHHKTLVFKMLKYADLLVCNWEEASELLSNIFDYDEERTKLASELHKLGPEKVVITNGSKGLIGYDGHSFIDLKPNKDIKVIDTTGAGDAFASTCTAFLLKGYTFSQACIAGLRNAESVISKFGAKDGLLTLDTLKSLL